MAGKECEFNCPIKDRLELKSGCPALSVGISAEIDALDFCGQTSLARRLRISGRKPFKGNYLSNRDFIQMANQVHQNLAEKTSPKV